MTPRDNGDTYDTPTEKQVAVGGRTSASAFGNGSDVLTSPQPEITAPTPKYERLSLEQLTARVAALVADRFGYDPERRLFAEFNGAGWERDLTKGSVVCDALVRIANEVTRAVGTASDKERKAAAREAIFLCSYKCFASAPRTGRSRRSGNSQRTIKRQRNSR